jgi:multisubunit Na+/H+ antiporter MnhF subunit
LKILYDFQALPIPNAWFSLAIMSLGLAIYLAFYRKVKASNLPRQVRIYNLIVLILVLTSFLVFFTKKEQAAEYVNVQLKYRDSQHLTVTGELSGLKYSEGFDEFFISQQKFIRYLPDRQVPQYGCWREYITDQKMLEGKKISLDYIVFPEYASVPSRLGGEKIDQICILRFAILE